MDLLDPFSCQLHHIAFDRLKSHYPLPCPGTQSINITLKFHCVFFILNFTIAGTVISKKSYFRLNIWWDVIYVQREQQGTKNGALGDTRQNRSPVRFYSIYNNSLLSEAKKRIYPFQCLATDSIAKQFAFKEFMRVCIKCLFKIQYECVNLSSIIGSIVQDFSAIVYYRSQLSFTTTVYRTFLAPNFSVRFRVRLVRENNFWTFMKWFFSPRFRRKSTFLPRVFGLLSVINDNSTGNSTIHTLQCFRQCCIKLIKQFYLYLA